MKNVLKYIGPVLLLISVYGCNSECMRCQKAGEATLNYCENDFPSDIAYHDQINGLDSLGYDCVKK